MKCYVKRVPIKGDWVYAGPGGFYKWNVQITAFATSNIETPTR